MIEDIVKLREKGFSFRKIAKELGTTVGKVQYRFQKHQEERQTKKEIILMPKEMRRELPASYERDELMLLPRTPTSLHAYFETSHFTRQLIEHQMRTPWHELQKVLRLYDITAIDFNGHHSHRFVDADLPEVTNNWYFHGVEENRTYILDLGVRTRDHSFFSIMRSNPIDTPRLKSSMRGQYQEALHNWQQGVSNDPQWLEHFSTYSYYESTK
ncbi:DUF4912 domain-containing protein [Bacillus sp. FJAT-45037]|uniref:DUF4912 domain-containing protein n=1 Tax=Bacillus sp. FJAT-45037 TaxID=2011007 RepID=UPI000C2467A5|nr:DUF4912 domain-containing protein [Bacillus sp. FJAT-45037]